MILSLHFIIRKILVDRVKSHESMTNLAHAWGKSRDLCKEEHQSKGEIMKNDHWYFV